MNPARLLVLSVAVCALPITELAQDLRTKVWIRQDLYNEGHKADEAGHYGTALKELSAFRNFNSNRLAAATSSDEIAFRDSLEAELKRLEQKIRQNGADEDARSNRQNGAGEDARSNRQNGADEDARSNRQNGADEDAHSNRQNGAGADRHSNVPHGTRPQGGSSQTGK